ncbi:plasmid partitioning protein [Nonomuraea sp. K274]|uniref:Plasmid partitioning protein n=1 Tax=Nonomuraea cypriaca TaxID=1187855 RepID=A0A931AC21_9ACTN|nr:plasmid partitioning protein [Nonomuraea cypriaca]MBF8190081.1 plasmid partitioning protein [Nonomuraea cypriaca]
MRPVAPSGLARLGRRVLRDAGVHPVREMGAPRRCGNSVRGRLGAHCEEDGGRGTTMARVMIILVLVALLAAAGCGGVPPRPAAPAQVSPTGGCATRERLEPGRHRLSFGGLTRRYLLSVPAGGGPHPVVLDLHGLGSTAAEQSAYSRLAEQGSRRGYVVATPQAAEGRIGWALPGMGGPDDAGFLAALLDRLEQGLCVDRRREFAAGMSYGAGLATALVCALDGRLAGVAAVAGLNIVRPCPGAYPTTIVAFHGTADRIVPYDGGHPFRDATGDVRALADLVVLAPVESSADGWARTLGCTGRSTTGLGERVRLRGWKSCPGRATLRLYTVGGGGHTWPGPIEVPRLGDTVRDLDATAVILDTFDGAPSR